MPDKTFLWLAINNSIHDPISCVILLVSTYNLDFSILAVCCIECEIVEYVKNYSGFEHHIDCEFYILKSYGFVTNKASPGRPIFQGRRYGCISVFFPLGPEGENVWHEQCWYVEFIVVVYLDCSIEPTDGWPDRCLAFPDNQRNPIDEHNDIRSLGDLLGD